MDAGGTALKPLKQQQNSTGSGRRLYPGRQADLQSGFGKMNFNFLRGTSAKDSRTSTIPSAGHTLRLCQSNLPWLSLDSTGRRNQLPKPETQHTFSKFLKKCNFRYIWNISPDHKPTQPLFFNIKTQLTIQKKLFQAKKEKYFVEKQ